MMISFIMSITNYSDHFAIKNLNAQSKIPVLLVYLLPIVIKPWYEGSIVNVV